MDALRAGIQAIGRNPRIVTGYILVSVVLSLTSRGVNALFLSGPFTDASEMVTRLVDFGNHLAGAAGYAALSAIAFSMLGADIDRPLWRYHGWRDALKRFFTPWFLLALTYILIFRLMLFLGIEHMASQLLLTIACIFFTLHLPVGVAIMHQGKFEWRYLGEALMPLLVQLPRMIIPIIAALYLFFLAFMSGGSVHPDAEGSLTWVWQAALLEVVAGIIACTIVAVTWCTLMLHRDDSDEDFDL